MNLVQVGTSITSVSRSSYRNDNKSNDSQLSRERIKCISFVEHDYNKMMLRWIIMIGTFLSVNTKPYMKKLSFEGCKHDSWRVTDISLVPKDNKIYVVADVGYDKNITDILHQITFTLSGCNDDYKCTSHSEFVANDLDCRGKNLTQLDKEACDVGKTLAEWEMDTGEISRNSFMNNTLVSTDRNKICVHYDTKLIGENKNDEKSQVEAIQ